MYVCVSDCIDIRMYEYIYILHMSLPQIPIERQLHILIKPQLKQANNFFPSYIPLKIGTYTLTNIYILYIFVTTFYNSFGFTHFKLQLKIKLSNKTKSSVV